MCSTAIFVLGMHRSGSSAVARVLGLCGASLPQKLVEANQGNPRGYWEPLEALNLNEEFLLQQGSSWDDPTLHLQYKYIQSHEGSLFIERIREFLLQSVTEKPLVIKEPRITTLPSYWFEAARAAGLEVKIVIPVRHPNEVIASLVARDQISLELASLLYVKYNLLAERESRNYPRVFVGYANLLENWRQEVARVSASLCLELVNRDENGIAAFLSQDLHRQNDTGMPRDWLFGTNWMSIIHNILTRSASGAQCESDILDDIYSAYSSLEFIFRRSLDEHRSRLHGYRAATI